MSKVKQGWQCPVCGKVYAPHVNECSSYHLPQNYQPYYPWPYYPRKFVRPYGYYPWWEYSPNWTDTITISSQGSTGSVLWKDAPQVGDSYTITMLEGGNTDNVSFAVKD